MGLFDALRDRLFGRPEPDAASTPDPVAPPDAEPASPTLVDADGATPPDSILELQADDASMATPEDMQGIASASAGSVDLPARLERIAGRLLDDEGLRGDLTDDEFQPLIDWAMAAAERLVDATADVGDEQAETRIDTGLSIMKEQVRAAGDAIHAYAEGDVERLRAALSDAGLRINDRRADPVLSRLFAQQGLAGAEVATQIASRLTAGPARKERTERAERAERAERKEQP